MKEEDKNLLSIMYISISNHLEEVSKIIKNIEDNYEELSSIKKKRYAIEIAHEDIRNMLIFYVDGDAE